MNFRNKVAVVTGAASGIGAATARQFAEHGARVAIVDRNEREGEKAAAAINGSGVSGGASFHKMDVSNWPDAQAGMARIASQMDRIDILVNNAGISLFGTAVDLPIDDWHTTLGVTLNGVFYCSKAVIPFIRSAGGGAIVNVASIAGLGGNFGHAAYNAAKGGVVNLTRVMAIDHIQENIRVNCVCPGLVDTPAAASIKTMTEVWARMVGAHPRGKASTSDEIASVILFLAAETSAAIVGATIVADGGLTAWNGMPRVAE